MPTINPGYERRREQNPVVKERPVSANLDERTIKKPNQKKKRTPLRNVRVLERTERPWEALKLRLRGLHYEEIAKRLGYKTPDSACTSINNFIKKYPAEDVNEYREIQGQRMDAIVDANWDAAMQGNTYAADIIIKAEKFKAKLFGTERVVNPQEGSGRPVIPIELFRVMDEKASKAAQKIIDSRKRLLESGKKDVVDGEYRESDEGGDQYRATETDELPVDLPIDLT